MQKKYWIMWFRKMEKNMYKFIVKNNTTLNSITIDSIHNYGLKEVERIHKEK